MSLEFEDENEVDEDRERSDKYWEAFMAFDTKKTGFLKTSDLMAALSYCGETTDENETY